jgi:hypothetical protein
MEWMLQVVDEIDDAIAIVRHGLLGAHAHIGLLADGLAAAAVSAAVAGFKTRPPLNRPRP